MRTMPSTHTSLHYHIVFSTKDRLPEIHDEWRDELHRYIAGTINSLEGVTLQVGGTRDHVHILCGLKPAHCLADVVRDTKSAATTWARKTRARRFAGWQDGYGAFTASRSGLANIREYIRNQDSHHARWSFEEEYLELLERHDIDFNEKYLW